MEASQAVEVVVDLLNEDQGLGGGKVGLEPAVVVRREIRYLSTLGVREVGLLLRCRIL
jgi:hypothetical protein